MKLHHLMYPLALFAGYNYADILDAPNPFTWSLQPPDFIHKQETKKGMMSVMRWKRELMQEAVEVGTGIPIAADGKYNCKMTTNTTFICDYR
tara:strand:- start:3947 stop:4222 length:276 start_codon:yes stop_codon:yes gene_type:complete